MDIPLSERQPCHLRDSVPLTASSSRGDSINTMSSTVNLPGLAGTSSSSTDAEPLVDPKSSKAYSSSKIGTVLKTLKLKVFYPLISCSKRSRSQEEPKVALRKSLFYAILGALIHVLPMGASVALVSINIREIYIGGELIGTSGQDTQKLAALQFAAKLHELVMMSSLTAIVLTYIRSNILCGDGIPLGALFAGTQFRDLSFFWSQEFWGAVRHDARQNRWKYNCFVCLLVTATLLGVSVGPSSAQLMRPKLDDWPAGGTTFWLDATHDMIFRTKLEASQAWDHCRIDTGDFSCPHSGWRILDNNYISYLSRQTKRSTAPETVLMDGVHSQRSMTQRTRENTFGTYPLYYSAYTTATIPMSSIADSGVEIGKWWAIAARHVQKTKRFWSRKDATFSINAPQPAVATICQPQVGSKQQISEEGLLFPNLTSVRFNGPGITDTTANFNSTKAPDDKLVSVVLSHLESITEPSILWFEALDGFGSTIHAVATFPPDTSSPPINKIYSCSLDSRYIDGKTVSTRNKIKIAYSGKDAGLLHGIINAGYPQIVLSAGWTQYLNPIINSEGSTAFAQMSRSGGLWNVSSTPDESFSMVVVEAIITTMTVNGIARTDYNISIAGRKKGGKINYKDENNKFLNHLLPKNYLGPGREAYELPPEESKSATKFEVRITANGYAYNKRGATQIAAMAVLLLYSLLALLHFLHTLWTSEQSNAWDTTPELFALAMNSTRTEALKNTGAGIDTGGVFREIVKVEVKEGDRLEFVFKDTRDNTDIFQKNRKYA